MLQIFEFWCKNKIYIWILMQKIAKEYFHIVWKWPKISHSSFSPVFLQFKMVSLVTLFDHNLQVFINSPNWTILWFLMVLLLIRFRSVSKWQRKISSQKITGLVKKSFKMTICLKTFKEMKNGWKKGRWTTEGGRQINPEVQNHPTTKLQVAKIWTINSCHFEQKANKWVGNSMTSFTKRENGK